jgi:nitrogen regulatory protein PII 2
MPASPPSSPTRRKGAAAGHEEAMALLGEKGKLYPKRVITVVVPDKEVPALVATLIKTNQTGKPGDGKIFVMPVDDAVRVRTGEKGQKAIL